MFNHAKAQKEFDEKWKRLRKEYKQAGMTDEAIEEIYNFDKGVFNRDRAYMEHLHDAPSVNNSYSDEDNGEPLVEPELAIVDDFSPAHSRYWWIEEIDDPHILAYIRKLSKVDIEILTLCVYEGYEQKEAAKKVGLSPSTLCYRFKKIKQAIRNL